MNLVDIEIQQLDRVRTSVDDDFKVSSGKKRYRPVVKLRGQINQAGGPIDRFSRSFAGNLETSGGHLVFRFDELSEKDLIDCDRSEDDLQSGDLITRVAGLRTNYRVTEVRPESPLGGSFLLVYVEFEKNTEERAAP
jgi:hypothetical protein